MPQEVVTAAVVGAILKKATATGKERCVKADRFKTNPGLQFRLRVLAQGRCENGVEVVQDGPVGLGKDVDVLTCTPGNFPANACIFPEEQKISAEGWVTAPGDRLRSGIAGGDVGHGGLRLPIPPKSTKSKSYDQLLRTLHNTNRKKHAKGR